MADEKQPNGWNEWSKYVLKELERLGVEHKDMQEQHNALREKFTTMQIKVAGIAAGTAILTSLIFLLLSYLLKGKG